MPVRQARRETLSDRVIEEMERLIAIGEWAVGVRIPSEPELVDALGVSRNTVREAVRALVHTGVLDSRPGDGTYVLATDGLAALLGRQLRRARALEVIEVRRMVERSAAGLAARRRTARDLRILEAAARAQANALAGGDRAAMVDADLTFHRAVVTAAHNGLLGELYTQMTASVRESIEAGLDPDMANVAHVGLHDELVDAVRDRHVERAEAAATRHLAAAVAALDEQG